MYFKLFVVISLIVSAVPMRHQDEIINRVEKWSDEISEALRTLSDSIIRKKEILNKFSDTQVVEIDGMTLLGEIAGELRDMMKKKVDAVKRIKERAELLSCKRGDPIDPKANYSFYDTNNFNFTGPGYNKIEDIKKNEELWKCNLDAADDSCDNTKERKRREYGEDKYTCQMSMPFIERESKYFKNLTMVYDPHFETSVNVNYSAIKISTSVYARKKSVLNSIRWSEPLDEIFKYNYEKDPTLTWQYFASPQGFMRLYPATKWSEEDYDMTYDFRTRSWYTESMAGPKDVVILLDRSGSMVSSRRNITAKHIVHDILDTLSDNDYINVYTFTNTTESLVTCFNDTLVQANEENLRLIRESLNSYKPIFAGNLHLGLDVAYRLLDKSRGARSGANCNRIIMLITEGLDYYDLQTDLLEKYNRSDDSVRIFTFLLGTEENDANKMLRIACDNLGYYVNITLEYEIREKVVEYLKVLSRPINLARSETAQPIWSALYVDITDRKLTNWLWHKEEGLKQRKIFIEYAKEEIKIKKLNLSAAKDHFLLKETHDYMKYEIPRKYTYLTTVSLPVYDKRPNMTTLLGVAAVDVPLDYIKTLMMPHELGVNGYAFIITNNGYVLMHPDHRTNTILKPTFNRVDLTEVELSADTLNARQFDENIIQLREDIVNQITGTKTLNVSTHMDDMKRIFHGRRRYFYTGIDPYSLVIALPDNYGLHKIKYRNVNCGTDILKMARNWKLHPDWTYCSKSRGNSSQEDALLELTSKKCKSCDLAKAAIQDLHRTNWFVERHISFDSVEYACLYDSVVVAFLVTHSGVTRWKNMMPSNRDENSTNTDENHFSNIYKRSIEEIWYKRTVEENYNDPDTYIFSIPFHSSDFSANSTLIMVTNAIFRVQQSSTNKAPLAVAGFQFHYKELVSLFDKIWNSEINLLANQKTDATCIILDNHGYVIYSKNLEEVGKLIAEVNKNISHQLEEDEVLKPISVFDYQGICFPDAPKTACGSSGGPACRTPIDKRTVEFEKRAIQKTIPTPCDNELRLYTVESKYNERFVTNKNESDCVCPYVVRPIKGTNLLLLVVIGDCCVESLNEDLMEDFPKEKTYNTLLPCYIAIENDYIKRPYIKCTDIHNKEKILNNNVKYCGGEKKQEQKDEL